MKILYIDDNAVDRVVAQRLATNAGIDLDVAAGAAEGIALFDANAYDGLVVDLIMPVTSGLEVVRHVRAARRRHDTPLIILTAAAVPELEEDCLTAGANRVLAKPVLFSDVLMCFSDLHGKTPHYVRIA